MDQAELERRYLGGMLMTGAAEADRYPVAMEWLTVPAHQDILGAINALRSRAEEVSTISVRVELQRAGRPSHDELVLSATQWVDYDPAATSRRLRELHAQRVTRAAALRAAALCAEGRVAEARETMRAAGLDASDVEDPILSFRDVCIATIETFQAISQGGELAIELGMHSVVDAALAMMPDEGDCVIIAARPGVGKSTVVDRSLLSCAMRGIQVGKISVEDGAPDFGAKALGTLADVPTKGFWHRGGSSREQWSALERAALQNADLPIRFSRIRSNALDRVVQAMAIMVRTFGCRIVAVDYIQRIAGGSGDDRRGKIDDVLDTLIRTARQLRCGLLLVSQLKRPTSGNPFAEPTEIDLKESGSLEEVAQGIVLLWRLTDDKSSPSYGLLRGKVSKVKRGDAGQRFAYRRDKRSGVLLEVDERFDQEDAP